jgi:hypothetical protein
MESVAREGINEWRKQQPENLSLTDSTRFCRATSHCRNSEYNEME